VQEGGNPVRQVLDEELDRLVDSGMSYAEARLDLSHELGGIDHPGATGKGTELGRVLPTGAALALAVIRGQVSWRDSPSVEDKEDPDLPTGFICGDCNYTDCNCRTSQY
jgi:hypothetical protein